MYSDDDEEEAGLRHRPRAARVARLAVALEANVDSRHVRPLRLSMRVLPRDELSAGDRCVCRVRDGSLAGDCSSEDDVEN